MAELLIKGGMVIDGTGNAGYEADVFVKDGKITAVGKGSTFVFAKVGKEGLAKIKVSVK